MIFGIGLAAVGYAIFYWGVHHFPGWDCPTKDGCRYGLLELLGIPKSWGNARYPAVGLTPGQQAQAGDQGTQPQSPENQKTPTALGPNNTGWINSMLQGFNAPQTFNNQNKLVAWNNCEGNVQGLSGTGLNNPFNIKPDSYQPATHGDLGVDPNNGVASFSTMTLGIKGTIAKINEPFARAILSNLQSDGSFQAFANAVGSSGWGTSGSCIGSHGS